MLTASEKKEILQLLMNDNERKKKILTAREYYYIDNSILRTGVLLDDKELMRKADNRIPHNFHQLISDEEVDYIFSYIPIIDTGSTTLNKQLLEWFGDDFLRKMRKLSLDAINSGCAWLHYWLNDNEFKYTPVPSDQIIPIMDDSLEDTYSKVIRYYPITVNDGVRKRYNIRIELWEGNRCNYFVIPSTDGFGLSQTAKIIEDGELIHPFEKPPFIMFPNNNRHQGNLSKYKDLIDAYDIVVSGYVNDVMDIQQVIYILENYAGTDLGEFTKELKRYKTVAVGNDGIDGGRGDLRTLSIDIPVNARNSLLETLKKQIYTAGQALSRDVESVGNASGETLKFFYRDLDLKVGDKEVEFTIGLKELVRVALKVHGKASDVPISITFTHNRISSDKEQAEICKDSVGVVPMELIWANHPFVDDLEKCKKLWEEENAPADDGYGNLPKPNYNDDKSEKLDE